MKAKITKRLVDSVAADKDEVVIWDTDIPGFGFKVTATGRKTYFLYYRTGGGRQRKPTIGQHGELTAEQARSIAKKWAADAALGGDISGTRKAERRANTIEQLADRYLEEYAQLHKKAISVEADRSAINNHITPLLGSMKIKNVTRADVEQLKLAVRNGKTARRRKAKPRGRSVVRGGPIIANRVIAVLSKMFACAMDWGLRNDNPARGVKKFKEGRKDRFLDADEIARLLNALDLVERIQTESQFAIAALRVLLFSGLRRSEVCDLRWKHVNLERGFIRLEDSKTGGRTVPINRTVIDIFNNLPRDDDDQAHVFLSDSDDGRLALTRPWYRIRRIAEIDSSATLHTLRHTFASWSVMGGLSLAQVGALLGHKSAQTTLRYADHVQESVRAYSEQTAGIIAGFQTRTPAGEPQVNGPAS